MRGIAYTFARQGNEESRAMNLALTILSSLCLTWIVLLAYEE